MLVDFSIIIYSENGRLVSQLSWNGTSALRMGSWWTSYPSMELVLVVQLSWFGTEVLCVDKFRFWIIDL
jgi:hypothetical protein